MARFVKGFAQLTKLLVVALSLGGAVFAFDLVRQDIQLNRVLAQLTFWQDEEYLPAPESTQLVSNQLADLADTWVVHPDVKVYEASFHSWQQYWSAMDNETEDESAAWDHARDAVRAQQEALAARPAHFWNAELLGIYIDEIDTMIIDGEDRELSGARRAAERSLAGLLQPMHVGDGE